MNNVNSLVSVVIISYNSSRYIIETLNSIKKQTYSNIELIVSDDCSTDETKSIAEKWLEKNASRFVRTTFVSTNSNGGVSANINNGLKHCSGIWIKILAADDSLVVEAIEHYVSYCVLNECHICASKFKCIDENSIEYNPELTSTYYHYIENLNKDLKGQRHLLYRGILYPGPTAFQSKESLDKIGGCREESISEEWPLQYLSNKAGYRVFPIYENLVLYRVHKNSLCRANKSPRYKILLRDQFYFFKKEVFMDAVRDGFMIRAWHDFLRYYSYYLSFDHKAFSFVELLSPIKICELTKRYLNKFYEKTHL